MNDLTQAVSTVGFPVVAFILLYAYITKNQTDMASTISKNTDVVNELKTLVETLVKYLTKDGE